jgi:hypothetical protein
VAERITLANGEDYEKPKAIVTVDTDVHQVGQITYVKAQVGFAGGMTYTGIAMVNYDARSPAERNAPIETAETSAVGRALAFAGYFGSPEGIAGAEEIQIAQDREAQRGQRVIQPQNTTFFADESSPVTRMSSGSGSGAAPRPVGGPGGGGLSGGASPAQVRFATKLWGDAGRPMPPPDFKAMNGPTISRLIDELKAEAAS